MLIAVCVVVAISGFEMEKLSIEIKKETRAEKNSNPGNSKPKILLFTKLFFRTRNLN